MKENQPVLEYQKRVLEQIEVDKYKYILVDKDEWHIMTDRNVINNYLPQSQHVNLQINNENIKLNTFSSVPVNATTHVFNTGGSIWGLDFCPKRASNDTEPEIQYLAVGGYNSTTHCHATVQSIEEYKNAIQIWRCDLSYKTSGHLLDLCILHDYGVVKDLKWCPLGSYEENSECNNWSKLGILSVIFGDGTVKILVIPHPRDLRKKLMARREEAIYLKIHKPRLIFQSQRSNISCQDWSGYLRLACGGNDGSITVWDVERSLKQKKPIVHVKIYYNGIVMVNHISWYSILDNYTFVSTDDQSCINIHNIKDPYIHNNVSRTGHLYCVVSWPGHHMGYVWTTSASISRVNPEVGDPRNKILTFHKGNLWSVATSVHHEVIATSGSEGCVNSKRYSETSKKNHQYTIYQLTYDQNIDAFKYLEKSQSKISPKDYDFHTVIADQTCSIHKVVWNPNSGYCKWIASGGKGGLCRIESIDI